MTEASGQLEHVGEMDVGAAKIRSEASEHRVHPRLMQCHGSDFEGDESGEVRSLEDPARDSSRDFARRSRLRDALIAEALERDAALLDRLRAT